jgi:hypothetical protein
LHLNPRIEVNATVKNLAANFDVSGAKTPMTPLRQTVYSAKLAHFIVMGLIAAAAVTKGS